MSYQVLARKWRPRQFSELVGQEPAVRALVNALDSGRLHHAFLFTGTRGVGKTTIARIFAKSLNCEQGVSSRPCGECSACREIDEGRFVDLLELDAASRTGVEDMRELLENVPYAPGRGRYKVYLIDEVHMLSTSSFNALLKTLEEPPEHVKFLLATTDPQKIPATVLSRCLQFSLHRLPVELIQGGLARILGAEGVEAEAAALERIARAADGSMRDALSLLDQAIAYGGGAVQDAEVADMLGALDRGGLFDLLDALAQGDGETLLNATESLAAQAPDFARALGELGGLLHQIAREQLVPGVIPGLAAEAQRVAALAMTMQPEDVQLYYQIALQGAKEMPQALDPRSGFEMALLRMLAFRPVLETPGVVPPVPVTAATRPATGAGRPPTSAARDILRGEGVPIETAAPPVGESPPPGAYAPGPIVSARQGLQSGEGQVQDPRSQPRRAAPGSAAVVDRPPTSTARDILREGAAASIETAAAPVSEPPPPLGAYASGPTMPARRASPSGAGQVREPDPPLVPAPDLDWASLLAALPLGGGLARELAHNCELLAMDGEQVTLRIDARHRELCAVRPRERLREALSVHLGKAVRLEIQVGRVQRETPAQHRQRQDRQRQAEAERAIHEDTHVQALLERFDAKVAPNSIQPHGADPAP